jgi:hypothetical protein
MTVTAKAGFRHCLENLGQSKNNLPSSVNSRFRIRSYWILCSSGLYSDSAIDWYVGVPGSNSCPFKGYSVTMLITSDCVPIFDPGTRRGWVVCAPAALPPGKRPGTHCTRGWVGLGAGLDGFGKRRPTGFQTPDHPAHSESLTDWSVRFIDNYWLIRTP